MAALDLFTLPNALAICVLVSLNAYVIFGGADFGGGVWDLLATGHRADRQRTLIAHAIGPIWEANHVWLILVIVLLFSCFPAVFATLTTYLHIPLALMLIGIVLRGSAFTFRAYDTRHESADAVWGRVFAIASVITPILLGVCVGTIASGALGRTQAALQAGAASGNLPSAYDLYIAPWWSSFPLACGALTLSAFAFLAAVYLTVEATDAAVREDFRRRALWAALAVFITAFGVLFVSRASAPMIRQALTAGTLAVVLHVATGIAAITAIVSLWRRRYRVARVAAVAQVSLILWGWAVSQYPALIPGWLTISAAAAPTSTLTLILVALGVGVLALGPSLLYLFRVFSMARQPEP